LTLELGAPQLLSVSHRLDAFDCGEASLDDWLKRRALANQSSGASRTFVVADGHGDVYGYYALAMGAVALGDATSAVRRNMPDPVPVMVLGRLAVDRRAQGAQLGGALLRDAVERTLVVSENVGVRAVLVHALHERAKQFYEHYGFRASPTHAMMLMLRLPALPSGTAR
jgi:GNAT superfamily N-acetyltransferase